MEMKPVLLGSPVISAISAPGGNAGLPGPHFTAAMSLTTCMAAIGAAALVDDGWDVATGPAPAHKTPTVAVESKTLILIGTSPNNEVILLPVQRSAEVAVWAFCVC